MHFYKCKVGNAFDEWTCQNMETDGAGGTLDLQEQGWEFVELSQEQREGASGGRDDLVFLNWKSRNVQLESPEVPGRAGKAAGLSAGGKLPVPTALCRTWDNASQDF